MEIIFAAGTVIASVVGVGGGARHHDSPPAQRLRPAHRRAGWIGLDHRIDALEHRMDGLEARMRTLEAAQNRLSGLLEGLGLVGQLSAERKPAS